MNMRIGFLALAIGAGSLAGACKKDEAKKIEPAATPADTQETEPTKAPDEVPAPASADFVASIMKPYEDCRALLAADKGEGLAECSKAMSAAAKAASASAPDEAKASLTSISSAADVLATASADDLEKARMLYGNVSKPVVALLTTMPDAATNYRVFECPMAKGYKRWVQVEEKMANPYMGTKMLECGMEVQDHKGMSGDKMGDHKMDGDKMGGHKMDGDKMGDHGKR
jgi:hypothetical protein